MAAKKPVAMRRIALYYTIMQKETISFRLDTEKKCALDAIAEATERDRSFVINEAITSYLELCRIEKSEIERRLKLARAGDVASDKEVSAAFAKWKL